jgi:hypothetical protein
MIIEALLNAILNFVGFILGFLPDISGFDAGADNIPAFVTAIGTAGFILFPSWMFIAIIVNVSGWMFIQLAWAVIEWIYKKIPGVN